MESHLLRSFVAMAQHKNLKNAATARHLSKAAVSRHLKELESAWKVELFARSQDGLHLTHAGEHLLPNVRHAITVLDALESPAIDLIDHITGTVAIGTVCDPTWIRAPGFLKILTSTHPKLKVHLHQGNSGQVLQDIISGRLSAGWVLGPVDDPALTARVLTPVVLRVVGPCAWADRLASASLADLVDYPWVDTPAACAYAQHRQAMFTAIGRQPSCQIQVDAEHTHYGIAAGGIALSLLREDVAQAGHQAGDLALWPGTIPNLHLRFVVPTMRMADPACQALLSAVMQTWAPHSVARPNLRHPGHANRKPPPVRGASGHSRPSPHRPRPTPPNLPQHSPTRQGNRDAEPWVDLVEIARHLQVHVETIRRWVLTGAMPAIKMGRIWRFKVSEVDAWAKAGGPPGPTCPPT